MITTVTATIDFETIETSLQAIGLQISASEAHGLVTGLVCGNFDQSLALMGKELLPEKHADEREYHDSKAELTQMHAVINEQLRDPELGFRLLLPAEATGVEKRPPRRSRRCCEARSRTGQLVPGIHVRFRYQCAREREEAVG